MTLHTKLCLWDQNGTLYPIDPDREPICGAVVIPVDSDALDAERLTVTIEHYREDGSLSHFWRSKPRHWVLDLDTGRIELPWVNERENILRKPLFSEA